MWNPVPNTLIESIKAGFFATWTGLIANLVRKYLNKSPERVEVFD